MDSKILTQLTIIFSSITRPLTQKFKNVYTSTITLPTTITRKITTTATSLVTKKETTVKDYAKIGNHYISKRVILVAIVLAIVGSYLGYTFLISKGYISYTVYKGQSQSFTGKATLYASKTDKTLLYAGDMSKGLYDGFGNLYFGDAKKTLKYKGNLKNGNYDGFGILYFQNGSTAYLGNFSGGLYDGAGKEYFESGKLKFSGSFKSGLYDGDGTLNNEYGNALYKGLFKGGRLEGAGTQFAYNGVLLEDGIFSNNLLEGPGKIYYDDGTLKYDGPFKTDKYDGAGILYYKNKKVQYKGDFKFGVFEGKGELNNENGLKIYAGAFKAGLYDGDGSLYNEQGILIFQGQFKAGVKQTGKTFNENGSPTFQDTSKPDDASSSGIIFSTKGNNIKLYEGQLKDNKYNGIGKLYFEDVNSTVKYDGEFANGIFEGMGTLYDINKVIIFKGYFKSGTPYFQGFFDKTDNDLKAVLGDADSVVPAPDGSSTITYANLNLKFLLDKNNPLKVLKTSSISVASLIDVFGINTTMSEAQVINKLGIPISASIVTDPLTNSQTKHDIFSVTTYKIDVEFNPSSLIVNTITISKI